MPPFPVMPPRVDDRLRAVDLRDPAEFLRRLSGLTPLTPGSLVALVRHPSTEQRLVRAVRVHGDLDPGGGGHATSDVLRGVAELLFDGEDPNGPVEHAFVTVAVRPGRCVFGERDTVALVAWRYSHHLLPVHVGDLLLVTPSGWSAFFDDSAGHTPVMAAEVGG